MKGENPDFFHERAEICMKCPHAVDGALFKMVKNKMQKLSGKKCDACGCGLQMKLLVPEEVCPKQKWDAVRG